MPSRRSPRQSLQASSREPTCFLPESDQPERVRSGPRRFGSTPDAKAVDANRPLEAPTSRDFLRRLVRSARAPGVRLGVGLGLVLSGLLAISCAPAAGPRTAPAFEPFPAAPAEDRAFLVEPTTGYPHAIDAASRLRLDAGYEALAQGDDATAAAVVRELLTGDASLLPARVLGAQVALYRGDAARALVAARAASAELPGYTAAELILGRSAEIVGELVEAYEAYRRAASSSSVAAARADELADRAREIVFLRVEDALARGRVDLAAADVDRLRGWAPDAETTMRAERVLAAAEGDREAELAAVERLAGRYSEDRELAERRAELEVEVGDAGAGLALYEDLARAYPDDLALSDRVESAKFRWRFLQLPPKVTHLANTPELSRGDFAVLAYWLIPPVRYGGSRGARIASDILDDPRREEISRVINAGMLDVDSSVHRFSPERPLRRGEALEGLLRVLGGLGGEPVPCASKVAINPRPSPSFVCSTATACGLLPSAGDCLTEASVSGGEALELIRRTLSRLGG